MKARIYRDGQLQDEIPHEGGGPAFSGVAEGDVLCYAGTGGALKRGKVLRRQDIGGDVELHLGDVGDVLPGLPAAPPAAVDASVSPKKK